MQTAIPMTRDLVLIGGGHAHALVLRHWGMNRVPGAQLTLIHPGPTAPYTGMLPGFLAGHYTREEIEIDMVRLARFAGARLILGAAAGIDRQRQLVSVPGRPDIAYDLLSIDIGVTSEMPGIPGFAEHAMPAKPFDIFAARWDRFVARAGRSANVVVIGGGVAGVELALAAAHRLADRQVRVTIVERAGLLEAAVPKARARLIAALDAFGIETIEGADVIEITDETLRLSDGRLLPADGVIGAAGARPHGWLATTGLTDDRGYIPVGPDLRSLADPAIYASGDCAELSFDPRPKAGVYAVRAAPVLAHNLAADLSGRPLRHFRPQKDFLKLVSLGGKAALADRSGLVAQGLWLWRQKDRIDRRFMRRVSEFPAMPAQPLPRDMALGVAEELAGPVPCGGCGAKLGPGALAQALAALPQPDRADVLTGAGDDAAVLKMGGAQQVISTDHLRAFALDPVLVARVAALHAMGDVWAMGATPQAVLAQITLPRLSARLQTRMLAEIMAASAGVLAPTGAEIVGGHSTEGAELTIGFTVTGLLEGAARTLDQAEPGDRLILTRPIGTGVLLAAEMAGQARGRDITALWSALCQPQGDVAGLVAARARAITDVTGFGLAGHLLAICDASGLGAELSRDDVPIWPGALELSRAGIGSSLLPANKAACEGRVAGAEGPLGALFFDPQTAGGFLAAVPEAELPGLLTEIEAAGHSAAVIGRMVAGAPAITVG